jgi:AraC-like DNA-binding protein
MPTLAQQEMHFGAAPFLPSVQAVTRSAQDGPFWLHYGIAGKRLRAIAADILQHLGDHELSISSVARRQRISDSYVSKLFQRQGTKYSKFVLDQRLARARALLSTPEHADRTILSIAFEVGFWDLSYFNRTFRRRYGATPSQWRRQALARSATDHIAW